MYRSVFLSIPLLCLVTLCINCPFVLSADAQTCGGEGVAVQVLGSGGPELQDKRASSSYLVWQDGQARVLVDAGIDEGNIRERNGAAGRSVSALSFHSLRHSFNSALANAGVSQELRQKLTGHASADMNTIYTHHTTWRRSALQSRRCRGCRKPDGSEPWETPPRR